MIDKTQLERMVKHNLKVKKVLFIVSMCLFAVATAFLATFIALTVTNYDVALIPEMVEDLTLRGVLLDSFIEFIAGGVITLLFSILIFGRRAIMAQAMLDNFDKIQEEQSRMWNTHPSAAPTVDVKPVPESKPKGKYDDLINEYQKLYDQGLISKEDLDNKKKELGYL